MKITLICNARLPSERAHPLQVMEMWRSFSKISKTELVYPFRFQRDPQLKAFKNKFWEYYGFEEPCGAHARLPTFDAVHLLDFFPSWVTAYSRVQQLSFSLCLGLWFLTQKRDDRWVWSREMLSLPILKCLFPRLPVFYEMHRFPGSAVVWQLNWLKKIEGVICISKGLQHKLIEAGFEKEKILVAPDAYQDKRFSLKLSQKEARRKLGIPEDRKMILYTGHLYAWKGVSTLVEAMRGKSDIDLHLVGGMPEDVARLQAAHYPWPNNVMLHGHKLPEEIPLWLRATDVATVPNSSDSELSRLYTSPLKIFEAMAMNVPLLVSDLPSLREIVDDNSATFVAVDDSAQWSQTIDRFFENKTENTAKAKRAKEKISHWTWDKRAQTIYDFMKRIVEAR